MQIVRKWMLLTLSFVFVSVLTLSAQQKMTNYAASWKKIDSLINKAGLPQSATTEVNKLYLLAKKEGQDAQAIKALVYLVNLQQNSAEDADAKSIALLTREAASATGASKAILQTLLADKYLDYYQVHRYQLYNRTTIAAPPAADFTSWSVQDFNTSITALYLAALSNKSLLQQTSLTSFEPIIIKGNARALRPTLYDLLAQHALVYFQNTEREVTKPANSFEMTDKMAFAPAGVFAKASLATTDSASLHYKALLIYQQLLGFHLQDAKPDALIDADINRLQFVHQHSNAADKDSLYEKALTIIWEQYPAVPAATQAGYLIAQLHAGRAADYRPLQLYDAANDPKNEYLRAAAICEKILQQPQESEGKTNAFNLLQQIQRRELKLATEKVNMPNQPFRTLVSYRNFGNMYCRLVAITDEQKRKLANRYDDSYWSALVSLTPLRSWQQSLPATGDHQLHSTEIKIDSLPVGQYLLLASTNADFSFNSNPLAAQYFYVSAISYINNRNQYFVLQRETGQPLPGTKVQAWWSQYDYNQRSNTMVKGELLTADKNGWVRLSELPGGKRQGNLQLELTNGNDHLFMDDQQYDYYREDITGTATGNGSYEKDNARVFLFTDRSIYRPGQTVYFKGIAVTKEAGSRKNKVYSGMKTTLMLRNANGEDIDSLQLTTNEYGSYSGKFVLPAAALNGEFTLFDEDLNGNQSFSVEEYKRPKFMVAYDTLSGNYKLNDSISITGYAKAYAGNAIDGALVKYRVQRVARFIYPWLYWKWGYPRASNAEMVNGVTTTGPDGKFTIRFKAIPDLSIRKELDPVFDYRITADITDLNGETRSGETMVPVGYKAIQLSIGLQDEQSIPADSLRSIPVQVKNLGGLPQASLVTVTISRLQMPDRLIRQRYWPQPDQYVLDKETYLRYFPHDEYKDEANVHTWPKEKLLFTKTDSSQKPMIISTGKQSWPEGWYVVEASTQDKYGATVTDAKYIQLFQPQSRDIPGMQYSWLAGETGDLTPGNTASISIGSAAANVFLIQETDKRKSANDSGAASTPVYDFINLKGKKEFRFPLTEEDRGGFGVQFFFVKDNRFYQLQQLVAVPWTNKELQLNYASFRDKTLPGSQEKWTIQVSGNKKEKLAAEMLAGMYDASLDQFRPHSWTVPAIWENFSFHQAWEGNRSFTQVSAQEKYWNTVYKSFDKSYDQLLQPITARRRMYKGVPGAVAGVESRMNEVVANAVA
ncbi:MAG TPA: MG2 domain-containing protein, partial [Chitinophagaceae bacterium]|nr:MG2 domain-containing protein [Chitinophagaceae bacterium]